MSVNRAEVKQNRTDVPMSEWAHVLYTKLVSMKILFGWDTKRRWIKWEIQNKVYILIIAEYNTVTCCPLLSQASEPISAPQAAASFGAEWHSRSSPGGGVAAAGRLPQQWPPGRRVPHTYYKGKTRILTVKMVRTHKIPKAAPEPGDSVKMLAVVLRRKKVKGVSCATWALTCAEHTVLIVVDRIKSSLFRYIYFSQGIVIINLVIVAWLWLRATWVWRISDFTC